MIVVGVYVYNSSHFLLYCVSDELCGGVVCGVWGCGVWCVVCGVWCVSLE